MERARAAPTDRTIDWAADRQLIMPPSWYLRVVDPRRLLLSCLHRYAALEPRDPAVDHFATFVESHLDALSRSLVVGHVTASAWIIDRSARAAVLVHHPTLGRWLQPGGHLEGDETTQEASLREAREETGLQTLALAGPEIFDLDVHRIPARGDEPEHWHYDVRHLVEGRFAETPAPTREVRRAAWVSLDQVRDRTDEWSVLRLVEKTARGPRAPSEAKCLEDADSERYVGPDVGS